MIYHPYMTSAEWWKRREQENVETVQWVNAHYPGDTPEMVYERRKCIASMQSGNFRDYADWLYHIRYCQAKYEYEEKRH